MAILRNPYTGDDPPDDFEPDPPLQVRPLSNEQRRSIAEHKTIELERKRHDRTSTK